MAIIKNQEITSVAHEMTATDWEIIFANDIFNKVFYIYIYIYILHIKYYRYICMYMYIAGDGIDHRDHKESKEIPEKHILLFH